MIIPPRRLVLSGGGIRVTAQVGALKELEKGRYLRFIREYIGVSAGALLCTMLAIGYNISQVEEVCMGLDFGIIRSFEPENLLEILDTFGCDTGENLEKLLASVFRLRGYQADLTFAQLQEAGKPSLRMYATDLNSCKVVEYSATATPTTSIIFALRASMCLPLYFQPLRDPIAHHLLVDGGVMGNYPIVHLSENEIEESLGLTFDDDVAEFTECHDFMEFVNQIIATYYVPRNKEARTLYANRTIVLPCAAYPMWNFEASKEDRKRLMDIGAKAVRDFIKTKPTNYIGLRRYSVS